MNTWRLTILDKTTGRMYDRDYVAKSREEAIKLFRNSFGKSTYDITDVKKIK